MNGLSRVLFVSGTALLTAVPLSAAETALPPHVTQGFEAYIAYPDSLLPVLESVQDTASAEAAVPSLRQQLEKLYDVRSGLQGINSLSAEQQMSIRQHYEKRMRQRWGAVYEQIFRLQNVKCYRSQNFSRMFRLLCMMLQK